MFYQLTGLAIPTHPAPPTDNRLLSFVAIGVNTKTTLAEILAPTRQFDRYQGLALTNNWTRNVGALADLFDISCLGNTTALFDVLPDIIIAAWTAILSNISDVVSSLNIKVLGKRIWWSSFELTLGKSHSTFADFQ